MAYSTLGLYDSKPAAADLSTHQFKFVTVNSSAQVALAGAGAAMAGVMQDAPASGVAGSYQIAGVSRLVTDGSGTSIAAGDYLKSDASGRGVKTTTNGDEVGAMALEASTAAGTIIAVQLVRFRY